jgi:hypothetical protein
MAVYWYFFHNNPRQAESLTGYPDPWKVEIDDRSIPIQGSGLRIDKVRPTFSDDRFVHPLSEISGFLDDVPGSTGKTTGSPETSAKPAFAFGSPVGTVHPNK